MAKTSPHSLNASKGSVHLSKGSLHASKGSLHASKGSVHASKGSLSSRTTMTDHQIMNSSVLGDLSSFSGSLATRTGAHLAVLSPIITSDSGLPLSATPRESSSRVASLTARAGKLSPNRKPMSPVEAVYANAVLFPEYDPSWMEDSNSAPRAFDIISNTEVASDHEIHRVYSCMIYVVCVGLALLIVVLGVVGFYVSFTGGKSQATAASSEAPRVIVVVCYNDPVRSRAVSFKIAQSCVQCCTHLVYDGLYSDDNGDVTQRAIKDQITNQELNSWRALKRGTSQLRLYIGLRSVPPMAETVKKPQALNRLMQSLRTSYADWDGIAVIWDDVTDTTPTLHNLFFQTLHDTFTGTTFEVLAHVVPAGLERNKVVYDLDALVKFCSAIVVHTHEFAIPGKAYPPCSFDMSEALPESQNVNWVHVLNELLLLNVNIAPKLLPTVSTMGKKYTLADPSKTDIGELVTGTDSPIALSETELIKKRSYYGMAVMNIEMDDSGTCNSSVRHYLLNTIHNELHGTDKHLH